MMFVSSLRSLAAIACLSLLFACPSEKITGFSAMDKEFFNQDSPFQRGSKILGDPCGATRECETLYCREGVCAQPCAAVACPLGAACSLELVGLNVACNDEAEVDTCELIEGCTEALCGCIEGACMQATEYLCRELCPNDLCADNATCQPDVVLGVKVCLPGGAPPPPPPPGAAVGDLCPVGDECDVGLTCLDGVFSVSFCTLDCTADGVCPAGSHCASDPQGGLCFDDCSADRVCSVPDAVCEAVEGLMVCL